MAKKTAFEIRMRRLEEIVKGLESDEVSLEDAVERYREGMTLVKDLQQHLEAMEKKIETLTADGQTRPFPQGDIDGESAHANGEDPAA
jgi:exodeoxyribonuclease VII small subunit